MTFEVKQQEKQTNVVRACRGLVAEQQTCRIEFKKRGFENQKGVEKQQERPPKRMAAAQQVRWVKVGNGQNGRTDQK
jgi:hypothetical protein